MYVEDALNILSALELDLVGQGRFREAEEILGRIGELERGIWRCREEACREAV